MAEELLAISKLRLEGRAARGTSPDACRDRLEKIATRDLSRDLAAILPRALPEAWRREGVRIFLRRVEVDLEIDIDASETAIARTWAEAIAKAALRAAGGSDAIRFDSDVEYLAAFLSDLVEGGVWQRWWFREFHGMRHLGTSAAIRTALLRDPGIARAVLARIGAPRLARLLNLLDHADVLRVLAALVGAGHQPRAPSILESAMAALRAFARAPEAATTSPGHFVLWTLAQAETLQVPEGLDIQQLYLAACTTLEENGDAAAHYAALRQLLGANQAGSDHRHDTSERIAEARRALARARAEIVGKPRSPSVVDGGRFDTAFGGAFLLWPHVAALPLDACLAQSEQNTADQMAHALRILTLCRSLGIGRSERFLTDGAIGEALLAPDNAAHEIEAQASAAIEAIQTERLCRALDQWAHEEGTRAADWRDLGEDRGLVLKSAEHGYWLRVGSKTPIPDWLDRAELTSDIDIDQRDHAALVQSDKPDLIAQLAQIALKRFVWRIPGFANASIAHMRANFLSMSAVLTTDDDRLHAALGAVPLSIMLNLTGLSRDRYRLPDGRFLQLSQEDT